MELFFNADAIEILAELTPATRHKVMDAAVHYCKTGEMPANLSKNVLALFKTLMALSKVSLPETETLIDIKGTRSKRPDFDRRIVENAIKTISDTFTMPQLLSDKERKEEQELMCKIRDVAMRRYDVLRPEALR